MRSVLCVLFLPLAWGALPLKNSTEDDYNWESFLTFAKSSTSSVIRNFMPFLMRNFSQAGLNSDCEIHLLKLLLSAIKWKTWAVKMLDASGKIPSGILEGTVIDFGSYDECLKIKVMESSKYSSGGEQFRGRFCMVGFHSPLLTPMTQNAPDGKSYIEAYGTPPDWAEEILRRAGGYLKRTAFWFGACVPSTCTEDDVIKITTVVSKPLGFNTSVSDCQVDEPFIWPFYSVVAVTCLGCLVFLCTLGTLVDSICRWRQCYSTEKDPDHVLLRAIKAFSVLTNTENLFNVNSVGGNLACFNGIRFLSATWIILGHTYFYTDPWKYLKYLCFAHPRANLKELYKTIEDVMTYDDDRKTVLAGDFNIDFNSQKGHLLGFEEQFNGYLPVAVMENFTIPVSSFFFMSGFLLVFTTWKALEKSDGKLNLLKFFIHKFWRMTPALGLTIALLFTLPLIDSGPLWNSSLKPPIQQCLNLWWTNFLYINNWWKSDQFCLIHTWYLAALMQFHLVGVILLIVTFKKPAIGIFFNLMLTVACATATAVLVIRNNFPMPAPGRTKDMDVIEDYNSQIYIKPFNHFITYQIGMVMGYLFLKYPDRKIAPKYQIMGWILAIMGALLSVYGLYGPSESIVVRTMYIIGHRIGWSLSIGWMCYACATGIGGIVNRILSWNAMYPLGQLSYLTYLLHPLVIIYRNAALRERVYYGHTELVFSFLSNIMMSLFLAFVGYIAVEMPFAILEKMIFKNRSKLNLKTESRENADISQQSIGALSP